MRSAARRAFLFIVASSFTAATTLGAQAQEPAKPAGSEASLAIGGLVQAQLEAGDRGDSRWANDNDRFLLRRARLNGTGKFNEDFDFRVELDLAGTLSNTTGLRAQLTDGYVNWSRYPSANIRVGQFKTPFGFEQLYADPRLITLERSLMNDRLTLNRQLGAQLHGTFLDKRLTYAVGGFNGSGVNNNFNDNDKFDYVGRVSGIPWQGKVGDKKASWSVGVNGFTAEGTALSLPDLGLDSTPTTHDADNLFTGKREGHGVDTQVNIGGFDLWAECLDTRFKPNNHVPSASFTASGWYIQGSYVFYDGHLQAVAKVESFDPSDRTSRDVVTTDTFGLNYLIKGNDLKVMVDYLRTDLGGVSPLPRQNKVLARLQVIF